MGDGTVVTVARSGERATINPSMGGTPLHRNVWVLPSTASTSLRCPARSRSRRGMSWAARSISGRHYGRQCGCVRDQRQLR